MVNKARSADSRTTQIIKASGLSEPIDTQPHVLSHGDAEVTFQALEHQFDSSSDHPEIVDIARKTLTQAKGKIYPKAVYQWVEVKNMGSDTSVSIVQSPDDHVSLDFGDSFQLVTHARIALISVYTAGHEFEKAVRHISSKGDLLAAYFLDLIGLTALDQVGETIKGIAEEQARKLGWGVSPFLSPGSVHGWDLEEQVKLCSMLPLEKIDVAFQNDSVLSPLKTVSCLIGLGPDYPSSIVGTTCRVCSKNETCLMKQNQNCHSGCQRGKMPGVNRFSWEEV